MKAVKHLRNTLGARIGIVTVLVFFSIVLIGGIWIAIAITLKTKRSEAVHSAIVNMETLSRAYERGTVLTLRSIDQVAKIVKAEHEAVGGHIDLVGFLNRVLVEANEILLVAITNEKGAVVAISKGELPENVTLTDRKHFKIHQVDNLDYTYISEPVLGRISKKQSVNMSRRINHADGSFAGIVTIAVDPVKLTEFYTAQELGKNGVVGLLGEDGAYRALRSGSINLQATDVNVPDMLLKFKEATSAERSLRIPSIDAVARFYSIRKVEGYPLYALVGIPEADVLLIYHQGATTAYWWGFVGTCSVLLFLGIAAFLATRMRVLNSQLTDDIRERSKTEKALLISEDRFRHLAALSSDWYWEQDTSFRFTVMSRDEGSKNGKILNEFVGKKRWEMPISAPPEAWDAHKEDLYAHRSFSDFEYKAEFTDNGTRWFSVSGEPLFSADGVFTGYRGTGKDITDRKESEAQMRFMAMHDALTALPNRALLNDRLEQAIARAERHGYEVWVLFMDLDRFKPINDSLGHKAGDDLLQIIAGRLLKTARDNDTVSRLGGDEFVIVLSDFPAGTVSTAIISRIVDAVAEPITLEGQQIVISCSIGAAVFPADGADEETLIEHADAAMYHAKKNGRNNFQFYASTMNERASERLEIEAGLRRALINGEFVLHYQPQVDLLTNEIVGVEALIRWLHPQLGLVAPIRFIDIAEETGLIVPIGLWVLKTACAQNKAWQDAGYRPLRMAVNLSARQFSHTGLLQSIVETLAESGLPAKYLDIEITESLLVTDVEHAVGLLHQIDQLGVSLSIDDFGTGYSSLMYLKHFPVDVLKIDRSFVKDITIDRTSEAIVVSIISLAHNLGIQVIAEGVEEEGHLAFLQLHKCDQIQGFYFSKPVVASAFENMLRNGEKLVSPVRLTVSA